jgi:hypothetical protein
LALKEDEAIFYLDWPAPYQAKLKQILKNLQTTPALQAAGSRCQLTTQDNHKYYAFLRTDLAGT